MLTKCIQDGSFHSWISMWVAGKTVWTPCHSATCRAAGHCQVESKRWTVCICICSVVEYPFVLTLGAPRAVGRDWAAVCGAVTVDERSQDSRGRVHTTACEDFAGKKRPHAGLSAHDSIGEGFVCLGCLSHSSVRLVCLSRQILLPW